MDVAGAVSPWLLVSVHLGLRGPRVVPARACWVSVSCTSLSAVAYVPALWAGEQDCQVELSDTWFLCCPSLLELKMFTVYLPSSAGPVPMPQWGSSFKAVPPTLCQEWLS